jgi:hypothetical protein
VDYIKRHWLKGVIIFYAFLHIAQIELFPFYHFAMYSQRIDAKENYGVYEIRSGGKIIEIQDFNYRKYVYLNNTLNAFAAMQENQGCHPASELISKYLDLLHLENHAQNLKSDYCVAELDVAMQGWLRKYLGVSQPIEVYRKHFIWPKNKQPQYVDKTRIL